MRRTAAGVLAGALALSGAVATALPANAAPTFALERLAGNDRYETSAAIATAFGAASEVIMASGEQGRTPDALAANFLAGVRNAPVLLTRRDTTPEPILTALRASGATRITVVGGPVAVSDVQIASLRTAGFTVTRVAGADRFQTAAAVAAAGEGATASNVGLVASGISTIDALAGGPLSFKGRHPLFLVTRDGIPGATLASMRANGITSVFILGGEAVVGPRVVAQLTAAGITINGRLAGANRSETSVAIANALIANFGFSANTFNLASGLNEGIDALGGAALSGKENRVLLVTNNATSAAPVTAFATARAATLTAPGRIFGGPTVVAATLETSIETAGGGGGNFQTLTVTPTTPATLPLSDDAATATAGTDDRTYSATGLTNGTTYRITLVNSANITLGANGQATFLAQAGPTGAAGSTGFIANTGTDIADITSVNNVATAENTNTTTVTPVNGSITFTIDGDAPGSVTPVVYVNGGAGGTATTGGTATQLEITATAAGQFGAPAETFGIGGATIFTAPQAASGPITANSGVTGVDKAANTFTTGTGTATRSLNYDANDLFRVNGISVGIEAFEAALSSGDVILTGSFTRDPAGISEFNLSDVNPEAATATATVGTGAASRNVTVTATFTGDVDQVVVQRAPVTGGTVGTFATVATVAATDVNTTTAGTQFSFVDANVALGSYQYRVAGINDGDQGEFGTASATVTTTAPTADTTSPRATATTRITDGGFAGVLDAGDQFTVRTDEALAAPAAGATLRITDADGTVVDLVCGTNATCALNAAANPATPAGPNAGAAAGTVLTVTVTGAPTAVAGAAGTTPGLQYNTATITNTAGITDVAGNRFDITTGDRVIDAAAS